MKELKQITVLGLGLLGASITRRILRSFAGIKTVGYSHRPETREKARQFGVATEVADNIKESVAGADIVILATPIYTFEQTFADIADALPAGCIVTDVGSTKVLPHRWAAGSLPKNVYYAGSHPIAGSEQRGLEFARDDLFEQALCILTATKTTDKQAVRTLKRFWENLGCIVKFMTPAGHDKILAAVSHLPHITAAALTNAIDGNMLRFAGKGFLDTSRIASGPANIWTDILMANTGNIVKSIGKIENELAKLKKALNRRDAKQISRLLEAARTKRNELINYKIKNKEVIP